MATLLTSGRMVPGRRPAQFSELLPSSETRRCGSLFRSGERLAPNRAGERRCGPKNAAAAGFGRAAYPKLPPLFFDFSPEWARRRRGRLFHFGDLKNPLSFHFQRITRTYESLVFYWYLLVAFPGGPRRGKWSPPKKWGGGGAIGAAVNLANSGCGDRHRPPQRLMEELYYVTSV